MQATLLSRRTASSAIVGRRNVAPVRKPVACRVLPPSMLMELAERTGEVEAPLYIPIIGQWMSLR